MDQIASGDFGSVVSFPVTFICAGNRRKEQNMTKKTASCRMTVCSLLFPSMGSRRPSSSRASFKNEGCTRWALTGVQLLLGTPSGLEYAYVMCWRTWASLGRPRKASFCGCSCSDLLLIAS